MKKFLILILVCHLMQKGYSQLPVQVFGGNNAIEYNFFWYKDVDEKGKLSLFNFTFFNIDYKDQGKNTYEIYQIATYNFTKNWGLASGGRFTGGEIAPLIALSYQVETKDLYLNIFPTVQYFTHQQKLAYSLYALIFYKPKINKTWKMFNQLAFEPLFDTRGHIYSYQQIRLGLEYKEWFQFGLGANLEQTGKNFELTQNYGVFIRKELN